MLAAGCAKREAEPAAIQPAGAAANPADPGAGKQATVERKQIQSAEMRITVPSYLEARAAIDGILEARQGYLEGADVRHEGSGSMHATLVLRVPAASLGAVMQGLGELGELSHESVQRSDVTEAYVDVGARLGSQRALERRLLSLVEGETQSVAELVEVERELARVRGDIEQLEGRQRALDSQIAMSTIRLEVTQRPAAISKSPLISRAHEALVQSSELVVQTGSTAILVAVALLPWVPLFAALALLLRWLGRRGRRSAPSGAFAVGAPVPVDRMSITRSPT